MVSIKIKEGFSFKSGIEKCNLSEYDDALNNYYSNFGDSYNLKNDIPIFVDTNVLIHFYKISLAARKVLFDFFKENKHRIYITKQVQKEFIRNREKNIDDFYSDAQKNISKQFKSDVINSINVYLEKHKTILIDYAFVNQKLNSILNDCTNLLSELDEEVKNNIKGWKEQKMTDDFLKLFKECMLIDNLELEEIDYLKKEFNELKKGLKENIKNELKKNNTSFPGAGDIIEKPDNPYGDYILFHEMLKFIKTSNTNIVFLTFEKSKNDWIKESKEPLLHYIDSVYQNTKKALYVIEAESFFEDKLDISFKSVLEEKQKNPLVDERFISQLLYYWSEFEGIAREIANVLGLERRRPTMFLLKEIRELNILEIEDLRRVEELSKIRNYLAHGEYDIIENLSEREKFSYIMFLKDIIDKLKAIDISFENKFIAK